MDFAHNYILTVLLLAYCSKEIESRFYMRKKIGYFQLGNFPFDNYVR